MQIAARFGEVERKTGREPLALGGIERPSIPCTPGRVIGIRSYDDSESLIFVTACTYRLTLSSTLPMSWTYYFRTASILRKWVKLPLDITS